MVVCLGAAVMYFELEPADSKREVAVEQGVGQQLRAAEIVVFLARLRALGAAAELPGIDGGIVAAGAPRSPRTGDKSTPGRGPRAPRSRVVGPRHAHSSR